LSNLMLIEHLSSFMPVDLNIVKLCDCRALSCRTSDQVPFLWGMPSGIFKGLRIYENNFFSLNS
jgi:hypothetical protein